MRRFEGESSSPTAVERFFTGGAAAFKDGACSKACDFIQSIKTRRETCGTSAKCTSGLITISSITAENSADQFIRLHSQKQLSAQGILPAPPHPTHGHFPIVCSLQNNH